MYVYIPIVGAFPTPMIWTGHNSSNSLLFTIFEVLIFVTTLVIIIIIFIPLPPPKQQQQQTTTMNLNEILVH